jgi:hypothetical protein
MALARPATRPIARFRWPAVQPWRNQGRDPADAVAHGGLLYDQGGNGVGFQFCRSGMYDLRMSGQVTVTATIAQIGHTFPRPPRSL